jgi:hypothetical protein
MKVMLRTVAVSALALGLAAPAMAEKTASGSFGGLTWEARSRIIGMTPTSDVLPPNNTIGGGDPIFKPTADKSGVVALIMDYGPGGAFICSGSLLSNRMSILTAAHCVSDGAGTPGPLKTTAYFFDGNPDSRTPFGAGVRAVEISKIAVNQGYTGQVIDQNDIAVLRLSGGVLNTDAYDLHDGGLQNEKFNVAGYGGRSTVGGLLGADARTGFLREGDNRYDFRFGDSQFGGFWDQPNPNRPGSTNFFGTAQIQDSWVSDFDSGLAANDASCRLAAALSIAANAQFCNLGVGAREVGVAGGDSGGPQFINGKISSVTSYGLSFGTGLGDCRAGLNSSCGEFSGYVPVYLHTDFIQAAMAVPEPATWAMMIMGFGAVGFASRRAKVTKVSFA